MIKLGSLLHVVDAKRVTALLAAVAGALTAAAPAAAAASTVDYVALGDSYSSGVGTGVYDPASGDCARCPQPAVLPAAVGLLAQPGQFPVRRMLRSYHR